MIKPYFSNKGLNLNEIFLSEKGRLIKDPVAVATPMNSCFLNYHTNYRTKTVSV